MLSSAPISRREWLALSVAGLFAAGNATAADEVGPPLYVAERAGSRVYILGSAIARDRSWLTSKIAAAIGEAGELWQEDPSEPCPFNRELNIELGRRASGQLFDDLDATEQTRVTKIANQLDFPFDMLQQMRPWAAGAVVAALDRPRATSDYKPDDINGVIQKMFQDRSCRFARKLKCATTGFAFTRAFPKRLRFSTCSIRSTWPNCRWI